ncbi:MAG: N-methyl-L-tryptophan oxidase [Candidatus Eremiobacteraeota bacterium]|nr:N-methyl-L-tryptophan oxidase [Candidatus Eremiobacteraeota bacterium]
MPARTDFTFIVLGLGGIGSGAAYWLSRRYGADVLGLEQFELGHVRGESQDHSRIIRLSYHAPEYVQLAKRAYETWAELESDSGEHVVLQTGGLDLGPRVSAIPLQTYANAMDACGVTYEHLDAGAIMRRWPQWRLSDDIHGLFQERGGIAIAARANAAHQRMAREHGATLLDRAPVLSVRREGDAYVVATEQQTFSCAGLAVAAGPWSNRALANFDLELPLEVTKEQVTYFEPRDMRSFAPERFPVWIWMDDPSFYGFPVFGEPAVKVAQDAGGKPVDPDTRDFEPDPDNASRVRAFLERYLPSALGRVHLTKSCLYTLTPDRDFVIDRIPGHERAAVAIGAGHAFKFASVLGRILAELTADGATSSDIARFSLERPILHLANPPRAYMV